MRNHLSGYPLTEEMTVFKLLTFVMQISSHFYFNLKEGSCLLMTRASKGKTIEDME